MSKMKGGIVIQRNPINIRFVDPWWFKVVKTYCSKCDKLTPCHTYQGHFMCNICGNLTGFWMTPLGFTSPNQPMTWNKDATALVTVECEMRI